MVLNTDVVTFNVTYINTCGEFTRVITKSFASAAGIADALPGRTRYINVEFKSPSGDSSLSGSLYRYDKIDNSRHVCNSYLVSEVTKLEAQRYQNEKI